MQMPLSLQIWALKTMPSKPATLKENDNLVLGTEDPDNLVEATELLLRVLPDQSTTSTWVSLIRGSPE